MPLLATEPCVDLVTSGYGALAAEYDSAEHATTRVLEALSADGLRRAEASGLGSARVDNVLEVGAGTGALTAVLLESWPRANVIATDASAEMLHVLASKLSRDDVGRVTFAVSDAKSATGLRVAPRSLVAAGLADPYLNLPMLRTLRQACDETTRLFVSVPSHRWARRERLKRLGVSISTTRFRTRDGAVVFVPSSTYDEDGLGMLLARADFYPVTVGVETSDALWSCPEVCWAVAEPGAVGRAMHSFVEDL